MFCRSTVIEYYSFERRDVSIFSYFPPQNRWVSLKDEHTSLPLRSQTNRHYTNCNWNACEDEKNTYTHQNFNLGYYWSCSRKTKHVIRKIRVKDLMQFYRYRHAMGQFTYCFFLLILFGLIGNDTTGTRLLSIVLIFISWSSCMMFLWRFYESTAELTCFKSIQTTSVMFNLY